MISAVDVLVVGGGPAGATAAATLSRASVGVSLVTVARPAAFVPAQTLSRSAVEEIRNSGAFQDDLEGLECFGIEATWGSEKPVFQSSIGRALGKPCHVSTARVDAALLSNAIGAGARVMEGAAFIKAVSTPIGWQVSVRQNGTLQSIQCSFLIDATGRSSSVAHCLGVRRNRVDRLCSVWSIIGGCVGEQLMSVGAAPYGWWYTAPAPDNGVLVCLMADADSLRSIGALTPRTFSDLLSKVPRIRSAVGSATIGKLHMHPCETSALERVAGPGWLAVGDAASVLDPISSAGVHKAVALGRQGAEAALASLDGEQLALRHYGDRRRQAIQQFIPLLCSQYRRECRWTEEPFWARRQSA